MSHEIGSISVGKRGDLVFIRKNDINIAPATNATAAVVHYANVGNIDTVVAGGIIRKRNGQLVGHNVPEIVDELLESTGRVLSRAKEFDRDERKKQISLIFPTNRRASLEQRFSATVFRSPRAKRLHDPLMRLVLSRTKTTNHPNSS
jgi:hypothetical protein